jgi:hypothetical protein
MSDTELRNQLAREILEIVESHGGDAAAGLMDFLVGAEFIDLRAAALKALLEDILRAGRWPALSI